MRACMMSGAAFLAALSAASAFACDPEEMNQHLTAVCIAALSPAQAAIATVRAQADPAEEAQIASALSRAEMACDSGDPREGVALAILLARLAGRIEARTSSPSTLRSLTFLP